MYLIGGFYRKSLSLLLEDCVGCYLWLWDVGC